MVDTSKRAIRLTDGQLRKIVKDTVHETLTTMGVDVEEPLEMQKDFQHLREWRGTTTVAKKYALKTVVGVVVAGAVAAFWLGFKSFITP